MVIEWVIEWVTLKHSTMEAIALIEIRTRRRILCTLCKIQQNRIFLLASAVSFLSSLQRAWVQRSKSIASRLLPS